MQTQQEAIKEIEVKTNQYQKENDIEFKKNKHNINVVLRGDTKIFMRTNVLNLQKIF